MPTGRLCPRDESARDRRLDADPVDVAEPFEPVLRQFRGDGPFGRDRVPLDRGGLKQRKPEESHRKDHEGDQHLDEGEPLFPARSLQPTIVQPRFRRPAEHTDRRLVHRACRRKCGLSASVEETRPSPRCPGSVPRHRG